MRLDKKFEVTPTPEDCEVLEGGIGAISGNVAIVFSHSGLASMMSTAKLFAPVAVDFYGELVEANPKAFDPFASQARLFT